MRERKPMLLSIFLTSALAAGAWAQAAPPDAPPAGAVQPVSASDEVRPSGARPRGGEGRPRMPSMEEMVRADLEWLRQNDLGLYADRVEQLLKSESPMSDKGITLWRVHRRVEWLKRLAGEDQARALMDLRLEFALPGLARAARDAAEGPARDEARRKLHEAVAQQVALRIDVQKAVLPLMEKRIASFREQINKQAALRQDLIAERLASLGDAATPLPDPVMDLLMEMAEQGREGRDKETPPPDGDAKLPDGPPPAPPAGLDANKQTEEDIKWLRDQGLAAFADRLEKLRKERNWFLAYQMNRRIRQIQSLAAADQANAIEGEKLRFAVIDQAKALREAAAEARPALSEKLKADLARQFDVRQKAQEAILATFRQRLSEMQDNIKKLEEGSKDVIEQRYHELLDAAKPIPEPPLVPDFPRRRGGERGGERGGDRDKDRDHNRDRPVRPADAAPPPAQP